MRDRGQQVRGVSILGATGTIGEATVRLVESAPPGTYAVEAVTANRDALKLADIARRLGARLAVVADPAALPALREALSGTFIAAAAGPAALIEAASRPAEWVMVAIVGAAALPPTLAALERGATVALANKECLVSAGAIVIETARRFGARLLPVDSEHSAIFQLLDPERLDRVEKIVLTASGGPFREWTMAEMRAATPEQAVAHPNWRMGRKISVDSATMMNKGLELIEAAHLFPVPLDAFGVVVHPQSIVHGLVHYADGSVTAQLATPDMTTPIAVALAWPARMLTSTARLDLALMATLTFQAPDHARFPALRLCEAALAAGGVAPCVLNAANEVAVDLFLERRIGFLDITRLVGRVLDRFGAPPATTLADVMAADREARRVALDQASVLA
ncbi:MAG: 1-deoxy-D-xylulose-5-phosphate reductoisomerase [Acetobacteraceae bacterium]|nr:1-deoxy-D-xylulose-5-phosphate reductoisomerase [Acetobacteraceae bacterium]